MEWNTGKPKQSPKGENANGFLTLGEYEDSPSIRVFFFEEDEWQDYDGNALRIRLWMEIPKFPKWRDGL